MIFSVLDPTWKKSHSLAFSVIVYFHIRLNVQSWDTFGEDDTEHKMTQLPQEFQKWSKWDSEYKKSKIGMKTKFDSCKSGLSGNALMHHVGASKNETLMINESSLMALTSVSPNYHFSWTLLYCKVCEQRCLSSSVLLRQKCTLILLGRHFIALVMTFWAKWPV